MSKHVLLFACLLAIAFGDASLAQDVNQNDPNKDEASQNQSASNILKQATSHLSNKQSYLLRYKFEPDLIHRWHVEHVFTTKTTIKNVCETTRCRNLSVNVWKILNKDSRKQTRFEQSVEKITMWRQHDEQQPIFWDSTSNETPHKDYAGIASLVGKAQATYLVTDLGNVVDRQSDFHKTDLGIGREIIPFPINPIKVGHKWVVHNTMEASRKDKSKKQIKYRQVYQLLNVKDGLAHLSFTTQILTPIENKSIESQVMQKKTKGKIYFDLTKGQIAKREVEWDSKVQGFPDYDSMIEYTGRFTQTAIQPRKVAATPKTNMRQVRVIRDRFSSPILRR